ncbi:MAG: hypothetical protein ACI9PY_002888 [Ascidiaceihabitans sp.]|jgi:hypothetical protein
MRKVLGAAVICFIFAAFSWLYVKPDVSLSLSSLNNFKLHEASELKDFLRSKGFTIGEPKKYDPTSTNVTLERFPNLDAEIREEAENRVDENNLIFFETHHRENILENVIWHFYSVFWVERNREILQISTSHSFWNARIDLP